MKVEVFKCDECEKIFSNGCAINGKVSLITLGQDKEIVGEGKEVHICLECMYKFFGIKQTLTRSPSPQYE